MVNIKRVLIQGFLLHVNSCLWHKELILNGGSLFIWRHWLELKAPAIFKGKQAPLQEVTGITELSLNPQEICKVQETLVMVEVALQELHQSLNVVC